MTEPASYGAAMALLAEHVIQAVHDEQPQPIVAAIRQALTLTPPVGTDPVVALITVIAASVPPGQSMRDRLAWVCDLDLDRGDAA